MGKQLHLPKTLRKQELRKYAAKVPSVRYLAQRFVQLQRLRQQVHAAEKGQAAVGRHKFRRGLFRAPV